MVLPEIEEEYEEDDGPKLSLTSLLLGREISEFLKGGHKNPHFLKFVSQLPIIRFKK